MCDDDCPRCGARHMSPFASEDLTEVIERQSDRFVILRSPPSAEDSPDYLVVGEFRSLSEAKTFLGLIAKGHAI